MNTTEQHQRQRWRAIGMLVGSVALLVALGVQLILAIPTTYTATSAIALRPLTAEVAADSVELLAHEYGVTVGSEETAALVRARGGPDDDASISVSTVQDPGTATVRIQVSSTSRATALDVANELADYAVELGQDDVTTKVVLVVEAGDDGVSAAPPRKLYLAGLLCLAALLLAGGLYRIRERAE